MRKWWTSVLAAFSRNSPMSDARRYAPSAERNSEPISQALARLNFGGPASQSADVLEIASGTGQHAACLARLFPHVTIWPTEYGGGSAGPEATEYGSLAPVFASIEGHCDGLPNVKKPIELDAGADRWPADVEAVRFAAMYACNVCHISPYSVTEGLFAGAGRLLTPSGGLFIVRSRLNCRAALPCQRCASYVLLLPVPFTQYGPFMVDGAHTAPSNEAFDERLRAQNAEWGVRDCSALAELAQAHGLSLTERVSMPANNFVLCFRRES